MCGSVTRTELVTTRAAQWSQGWISGVMAARMGPAFGADFLCELHKYTQHTHGSAQGAAQETVTGQELTRNCW